MSKDKETSVIYTAIADKIASDIANQKYAQHQKLPSEYELASRYKCSRLTIRKAIDLLQKKNIVVRQKYRGTYLVSESSKVHSGESGLVGFTEAGKRNGYQTRTKVLDMEEVTEYPEAVKNVLRLEKGDRVWYIKRIRYADGIPMTVESIYLRSGISEDITQETVSGSLFELIEKKVAIGYSHQEVDAVLVDESIGQLLEEEIGKPVFLVHTTSFSIDGYPILYDRSFYRADQYTFQNILYRDPNKDV